MPVDRYLRLLGFDRPPSGERGLREIVSRHVQRVPFENVSKLLLHRREGRGRPTTLEEFLDGIERHDLGGTCYSSNPFLAELLNEIGYDADLLGADMDQPDVHTCLRVRSGGRSFHVDVGYGAPFTQPFDREQLPVTVVQGRQHYVIAPRDGDRVEVGHYRDGERIHGYVAHGPPRRPEFFHPTIVASFGPDRTFMTRLRIARFFDDRSVDLTDRTLVLHRGGTSEITRLRDLRELRAAVDGVLGLPRCPVERAVEVLEELQGRGLFPG